MKYIYVIGYHAQSKNGDLGFGSTTISRKSKIKTSEDVQEIRDLISKKNVRHKIVILAISRLGL